MFYTRTCEEVHSMIHSLHYINWTILITFIFIRLHIAVWISKYNSIWSIPFTFARGAIFLLFHLLQMVLKFFIFNCLILKKTLSEISYLQFSCFWQFDWYQSCYIRSSDLWHIHESNIIFFPYLFSSYKSVPIYQ